MLTSTESISHSSASMRNSKYLTSNVLYQNVDYMQPDEDLLATTKEDAPAPVLAPEPQQQQRRRKKKRTESDNIRTLSTLGSGISSLARSSQEG